jgi:hypothetical protein
MSFSLERLFNLKIRGLEEEEEADFLVPGLGSLGFKEKLSNSSLYYIIIT